MLAAFLAAATLLALLVVDESVSDTLHAVLVWMLLVFSFAALCSLLVYVMELL